MQLSIDFPPLPYERQSGRDVGHKLAKLAAAKAGQEWHDKALAALKKFARANAQFSIEQVRAAFPMLAVRNAKAWGAVAMVAKKEGVIAPVGACKTAGGRMVATLWESRVI